jgi:MoaA/NifB/PqqE/SkfB family radical SAM enzyme
MPLYRCLFNHSIRGALGRAIALVPEIPESASALRHILEHQPVATRQRKRFEPEILVPPLFIISTTERCNLQCKGCYARALHQPSCEELTRPQMDSLLSQAVDAGCSALLLAGGEPLLRPDWLASAASHPALLTLVFTNGTLLGEKMADRFARCRSLIPVVSIEGGAWATDARRGEGMSEKIYAALRNLKSRNIPFGLSVTVSRENFDEVTGEDFLAPYLALGCKLAVFVEYVPVDDASKSLALTPKEKKRLYWHCWLRRSGALRIAFPGNERFFGGCLAAGRGFVHISASGDVEACPFAGYADRNIKSAPLIDALKSPLLTQIRRKHSLLRENAVGGCALRGEEARALLGLGDTK